MHFRQDILQSKIVVINFIFTRCTMICPPMGAMFGRVQKALGDADDVQLLSISIDPRQDTPELLKAFGDRFGKREGWSLLTGDEVQLRKLIRALGGPMDNKEAHSPVTIIGDVANSRWTRVHGLVDSKIIMQKIEALRSARKLPKIESRNSEAARQYFTDTVLTNQYGEKLRFYSDILKDRTVLINFIFTRCNGACPLISKTLAEVQENFKDRLGKDLAFISLSVDPSHDNPAELKRFAQRQGAKKGWYFLTGQQDELQTVLKRVGGVTLKPEEHSSVILIGDMRSGIWTKAAAQATAETLIHTLQHLNDKGIR